MGKPELAWDTLREEIQTHLESHGGIQMTPRLAQELAEIVQVWDNETWEDDVADGVYDLPEDYDDIVGDDDEIPF